MRFFFRLGKFFFYILIIAVLSGIVYYNRNSYRSTYKEVRLAVGLDKPCEQPITYSIGVFDERFGISRSKFLEISAQSTGLWDTAINGNLFKYSPDGDLKINLIYDDRQKTTAQLNVIGGSIDSQKNAYDALKGRYDSLKGAYLSKKASLDAQVQTYDAHKAAYEQNVSYWNGQGGAPKNEYADLERQRLALNAEVTSLNTANKSLNAAVDELNAAANAVNSTTKDLNKNVATYNTIGAANGPEFQEGEYVRDNEGERINIYQYKDYTKLVRVLSHEFGHALGLDHVSDPKAIMYTYNSGNNEKLTAADVTELKKVCQLP